MSSDTGQSVGIDISEQHRDVHLHPAGLERRPPDTAEGTESLIELLKGHAVERLVLEGTSGVRSRARIHMVLRRSRAAGLASD